MYYLYEFILLKPWGTFKQFDRKITSLKTLESAVDPSQPGKTYINYKVDEHTSNTFVVISHFLVLYLLLSASDTLIFM